jgi:hypothetical protein
MQPPPVYQQQQSQQQWQYGYGEQKPKRKKTSPWLIGCLAVIAIGVIVILSFIVGTHEPSQPSGPAQTLTEEGQIRKLVSDQLKGKNNLEKDYIREIEVVKEVDGGWGVFVYYNADDNLTNKFIRGGIESKMTDIYAALYTSDKDIRQSFVAAYFPLVDKYGNESDAVVYKSILRKEEADKVNWNADRSLLENSILPKVWTTSILHPDFRE